MFYHPITPILEFSQPEGRGCRYQQFAYGSNGRFAIVFDEDVDTRIFERIDQCFEAEADRWQSYRVTGERIGVDFHPVIFAERKACVTVVCAGKELPAILNSEKKVSNLLSNAVYDTDCWEPAQALLMPNYSEYEADPHNEVASCLAHPSLSLNAFVELTRWRM